MEIAFAGTDGDGHRVQWGRLGRILIVRGRMGINVRPCAGLYSEMVQDGWDHMTHFKFVGPNDICGMAEARVVKCYTQVDCHILAYKAPLNGIWSESHDPYSVSMPTIICLEWLKRVVKFCKSITPI